MPLLSPCGFAPDEVYFRGQLIGAVVAESPQIARDAADLVRVDYAEQPQGAELRADRGDLYAPEQVNPNFPTDTAEGDVEAALAAAAVTRDQTYTTPMEHNNPMEPHTTVARWADGGLALYDSTQGVHSVRTTLAPQFGLDPTQIHVCRADRCRDPDHVCLAQPANQPPSGGARRAGAVVDARAR